MSELKRHMGLFGTTMYGIGLILGAGIYVLIGQAAGIAGNVVWVSFVFGAVAAVFSGLSYAELSSMFPKSAAEFLFVKNAFRNNFLAFLIGWMTLFTSVISASTVALGFGGYLTGFFGLPIVVSAVSLIALLSLINFIGIRESSWMNVIFTLIEASGLILIIYLGFTYSGTEPVNYFENPSGLSGISLAFVLIFFAFIGFEDIVNIAEETKNPKKILPRAIILAISITATIYILVSLAAIQILNWQELGASLAPLADVAKKILGNNGQIILSIIALFATANTVLIILVAGSRIIYGMATQHSLPLLLSRIHHRTKTPWIAVLGIMITAIIFSFLENIVTVANISVFFIAITFGMINLSVILLRYREPTIERPFKIPVNIGRFPLFPLFGVIISAYMMTQFSAYVISIGIGVIVAGALFYALSKKHMTKTSQS
ncbi:MAG TPA: amino acid permease [Nitrosopumilaceae archaeon]|nr:amino acid permease [Nitrosopumilaceae archaeon]